MLIATPTEIGFQNNFLGALAYLTPFPARCNNNTFISHGGAVQIGSNKFLNSIFVGAKNDA
jgi:hypothetical protein